MYRITLADGTVLDHINVNATTLVSATPIDESIFEHNLSPVEFEWFEDEGDVYPMMDMSGTHENMAYQHIECPIEGEYWFALYDVPEEQLRYEKIMADIEYISMMTDIEL